MADISAQRRAEETLGKIGQPSIRLLIKAPEDERVRRNAAKALGKIGSATAC